MGWVEETANKNVKCLTKVEGVPKVEFLFYGMENDNSD